MSDTPKKSKVAKVEKKVVAEPMEVETKAEKPPKPRERKPKVEEKSDFILVCSVGDAVDWKRFDSEEMMYKSLITTICFTEKRTFPSKSGQGTELDAYKKFLMNRKKSDDPTPKDVHYAFESLKNITKLT
jgi:hypothetical protein